MDLFYCYRQWTPLRQLGRWHTVYDLKTRKGIFLYLSACSRINRWRNFDSSWTEVCRENRWAGHVSRTPSCISLSTQTHKFFGWCTIPWTWSYVCVRMCPFAHCIWDFQGPLGGLYFASFDREEFQCWGALGQKEARRLLAWRRSTRLGNRKLVQNIGWKLHE
jgi:hypothetical protein